MSDAKIFQILIILNLLWIKAQKTRLVDDLSIYLSDPCLLFLIGAAIRT